MSHLPSWGALLLGLTAVVPSVRAQAAPELSRIPADANLVIHFQAKTFYTWPVVKEMRDVFAKRGPEDLQLFDERFLPGSQQFDRITGVMMSPDRQLRNERPAIAVMVTTLANIDPTAFPERMGLKARAVPNAPFPTWVEERGAVALALPEAKMFIFGSKDLVKELAAAPKNNKVPTSFQGLDKFHLALLAKVNALPAPFGDFLPPPLSPLAKANTFRATVMLHQRAQIDIQMNYNSEKDAELAEGALRDFSLQKPVSLEKPVRQIYEMLKSFERLRPSVYADRLEMLGADLIPAALYQAEEILQNPSLKRQGATLAAEITARSRIPSVLFAAGGFGTSMTFQSVAEARVASERQTGANQLKQLGVAIYAHHDAVGSYPIDITDKKGKPLLSWRVSLLPYIEQQALYKQFKLDEPWDSENNRKLAKTLIKVYQDPNQKETADAQGNALTHYMVFTGKGSLFPGGKKPSLRQITDGTSNTILCVEAKVPCPWTKPQDLPFDKDKDFPALDSVVGLAPNGFRALLCDGSVHWFNFDLDRKTMKLLIMPSDGNEVKIPKSN